MQHTGTGRPTSRRNRLRVWLVVVLALGLLASACSDSDSAGEMSSPATTDSASDRSSGVDADLAPASEEDRGTSGSRDIAELEYEPAPAPTEASYGRHDDG